MPASIAAIWRANPDVENAGMRAVAERLGFTFEGVQRGFMPSSGGPRDYAMYGVTRADHEQQATRTG